MSTYNMSSMVNSTLSNENLDFHSKNFNNNLEDLEKMQHLHCILEDKEPIKPLNINTLVNEYQDNPKFFLSRQITASTEIDSIDFVNTPTPEDNLEIPRVIHTNRSQDLQIEFVKELETINSIHGQSDSLGNVNEDKFLMPQAIQKLLFYKNKFGLLPTQEIQEAYLQSQAKFHDSINEFKEFLKSNKELKTTPYTCINDKEEKEEVSEEGNLKQIRDETTINQYPRLVRILDPDFLSDIGDYKSKNYKLIFDHEVLSETGSAPTIFDIETLSDISDDITTEDNTSEDDNEQHQQSQQSQQSHSNTLFENEKQTEVVMENYKATYLLIGIVISWIAFALSQGQDFVEKEEGNKKQKASK